MFKKLGLRILTLHFIALPLSLLTPLASAEDAPPPPAMAEVFFCKYNDGKDADDLRSTRDFIVKQLAKTDIDPLMSVAWHNYKGSSPADFLWMTFHESPLAYGANIDAIAAEPATAPIFERFQETADCTAALAIGRPVVQVETDFEGPTYINALVCELHDGVTNDDLGDLAGHYRSVWGALDTLSDVPLFTLQPVTGSDTPDRVIVSVHKSGTDWAEDVSALVTSDEGQALFRHRNALMECHANHWRGELMIEAGN